MRSEYICVRKFRARIARHRICDPSQFRRNLGKKLVSGTSITQCKLGLSKSIQAEAPSDSAVKVTGVVSFGSTYHGGRNCIGRNLGEPFAPHFSLHGMKMYEMAWGFWNDYLVFPATIQSLPSGGMVQPSGTKRRFVTSWGPSNGFPDHRDCTIHGIFPRWTYELRTELKNLNLNELDVSRCHSTFEFFYTWSIFIMCRTGWW